MRLVIVGPREHMPLMDAAEDRAAALGLEVATVIFTKRQTASAIAAPISTALRQGSRSRLRRSRRVSPSSSSVTA